MVISQLRAGAVMFITSSVELSFFVNFVFIKEGQLLMYGRFYIINMSVY